MRLYTILLLLSVLVVNAQSQSSRLDLRFGVGSSFLGTGDMQTIMFENELNFRINDYLTIGQGLAYAKSDFGVYEQASFIQINSLLLVSPFSNVYKNDFRIGTGLSLYSVSDLTRTSSQLNSGFDVNRRNSYGLNLVIENSYAVTEHFLVGIKAFIQPYINGDINSGILLKVGFRMPSK